MSASTSANIRRTTLPFPWCISRRTSAPAPRATSGAIRGIVVVDIDGGLRQRAPEIGYHLGNRCFFIETGDEHRQSLATRETPRPAVGDCRFGFAHLFPLPTRTALTADTLHFAPLPQHHSVSMLVRPRSEYI